MKQERIIELKKLKKLANKYLAENTREKELNPKSWEREVHEKNIKQLKKIITQLKKKLTEKALVEYIKKAIEPKYQVEQLYERMRESSLAFKIITFSPSYSVVNDLHWIDDGTVRNHIDIAIGEKSPEILGNYLGLKLQFAEAEIFPYLEKDDKYFQVINIFTIALNQAKKGNYLACNILLITGIESLVRLLAKFVYSNQNPEFSEEEVNHYIYERFLSLERLILKGDWKEDLLVTLADAIMMSDYVHDASIKKAIELETKHLEAQKKLKERLKKFYTDILNESNNENQENVLKVIEDGQEEIEAFQHDLIPINEKNIGITFRTRLTFLCRRYKADRNKLIHGKFDTVDKKWKTYIYWTALKKVFLVLKEYNERYK